METVVLKSTRYNCHIFFGESICLWRQRRVQDKNCVVQKGQIGEQFEDIGSIYTEIFNRTTPIGTFKKFGSTDTSICDKTSVGISFDMRREVEKFSQNNQLS